MYSVDDGSGFLVLFLVFSFEGLFTASVLHFCFFVRGYFKPNRLEFSNLTPIYPQLFIVRKCPKNRNSLVLFVVLENPKFLLKIRGFDR
jgi:hypothetical protein